MQIKYYFRTGYKTIGSNPNLINILTTTDARNMCMWYDGTMLPAKGHNGACGWKFDGQVFYHV